MSDLGYVPVPVIASFNTSGKILPIWFRYEDCTYNVMVLSQRDEFVFKYFECEITKTSDESNKEYMIGKRIELIFNKRDCFWGLSKNKS